MGLLAEILDLGLRFRIVSKCLVDAPFSDLVQFAGLTAVSQQSHRLGVLRSCQLFRKGSCRYFFVGHLSLL